MRPIVCALITVALGAAACSDPAPLSDAAATTPAPTDSSEPTPAPPTSAPLPSTREPLSPQDSVTTTGSGVEPGAAGTVVHSRVGIGDEYYPFLGNPGYDVRHYELALDFDPGVNTLTARASIRAVALTTLSSFNLDFDRLTIASIRVDGEPVAFVLDDEELTIQPVAEIRAGAEFIVEIDYFGTPGPEPSDAIARRLGWFTAGDGSQAFVASEPDAAHTWFPSNDHPLDKATFRFSITVPEGLTAAANGVLTSVESPGDGRVTWNWEMVHPMATYLATVVIGDFDIVPDPEAADVTHVPIRHVLPRGTTIESWPGLDAQGEMIAFLEELFGPYPFDVYGIVIVDDFGMALENQTLSIFGSRVARSDAFEMALVHEVAHQWFGNSVSTGLWRDIWLNEGFAAYSEWLWVESARGREALESAIEAERARLSNVVLRPPGDPLSDDLFNLSVYRRGAMTLHALRLEVGDARFFEILRTYVDRFRGGTATTADFVAVAAEVVGAPAVGALLDSWLFDDDIPEFPVR